MLTSVAGAVPSRGRVDAARTSHLVLPVLDELTLLSPTRVWCECVCVCACAALCSSAVPGSSPCGLRQRGCRAPLCCVWWASVSVSGESLRGPRGHTCRPHTVRPRSDPCTSMWSGRSLSLTTWGLLCFRGPPRLTVRLSRQQPGPLVLGPGPQLRACPRGAMWPAPGGDRQPRFPEAHRPRCVPGTRGAGAFRPRVSRGRRQLSSCWAKRLLEVPTLSLAMSPSLRPPFGRAGFLCESRGPGGAGVVPPLRAPLSLGPVPGLPRAHHPPRSRASVGVRAAPASPACWARLIHACALGLCGEPRGGGVGGSGVLDTWGGGGGGGRRGQRTLHREGSHKHGPLALRVGLAREPSKAGSTTWRVLLKRGLPPTPTPSVVMRGRTPPRGAHVTATSERAASGYVSRLCIRSAFRRWPRLAAPCLLAPPQPSRVARAVSAAQVVFPPRCEMPPGPPDTCAALLAVLELPVAVRRVVSRAQLGSEAPLSPLTAGARCGISGWS